MSWLPVIITSLVIALVGMYALRDREREIVVPPPDTLRTDLLFGYYGSVSARPTDDDPHPLLQIEETRDHVNVHWESFWEGDAVALRSMKLAQDAGMALIVDVSAEMFERTSPKQLALRPDAEHRLGGRCRWLIANDLARSVRSLFVLDEPDLKQNQACALIPEAARILRDVMARFPELADKRTAINYTTDFCHKHLFDDIGFDRYQERSGVFRPGGEYDRLVKGLLPNQRTYFFAGGYSDYRQDPTPFINFAHAHPEVFGVFCFLWRDPHGNGFQGISSDPEMRALYIAAGKSIVGG